MTAKSLKPSNSCFSCGSSGVGVRQLKQEISDCTLWFVHEDLPKFHGGSKRVDVSSDQKASACSQAPDRERMTERLGRSGGHGSSSLSFAMLVHIAKA